MQLEKKFKHLSIAHKILHDLPTSPIPSLPKKGCQMGAFFHRTLTRWETNLFLTGDQNGVLHLDWVFQCPPHTATSGYCLSWAVGKRNGGV